MLANAVIVYYTSAEEYPVTFMVWNAGSGSEIFFNTGGIRLVPCDSFLRAEERPGKECWSIGASTVGKKDMSESIVGCTGSKFERAYIREGHDLVTNAHPAQ